MLYIWEFISGIYDFYQNLIEIKRFYLHNVTVVNFPIVKCYFVEKILKTCYHSPFAIFGAYHIEYPVKSKGQTKTENIAISWNKGST